MGMNMCLMCKLIYKTKISDTMIMKFFHERNMLFDDEDDYP